MIKYIATDLDGTLFYPKDRRNMIRKENLFFLQSFIDGGGKLILCSGRSLSYLQKVEKVIGRTCAKIAFNGGAIEEGNEIIKFYSIPKNEVRNLIAEIRGSYNLLSIFLVTSTGAKVHVKNNNYLIRTIGKMMNNTLGKYKDDLCFNEQEFLNALNSEEEIYKIMLVVGITHKKKMQAKELNRFIRGAYLNLESSWSNEAIEISPKDCSKGNALIEYCELNNIDRNEVMVVGDSGNDISMFKAFEKNSFCMKRAPATVQKYAKYTISKFEDLSRYLLKK